MSRKIIYHADIDHLQILDENGVLDEELAKDTLTAEEVKSLYEVMILSRECDDAAFKLQRSGRMGTYPANKGSEATALGAAASLTRGVDQLIPCYRETPALCLHGMPMDLMFLFWLGDERGNILSPELNLLPMQLEIGSQIPHATGIAWAFKLRKEKRVALCFLGDGATSEGDFHCGLNFASTMRVPCVFTCINNGWAISLPASKQTASQTFAQKALAYGMPTIQVDGNDLFAVYKAHKQAVARAREGLGPSFIEAVTYRMGDHTTADDSRRYRPADELTSWAKKDPMHRIRKYLEGKGLWNAQLQAQSEERAKAKVHAIIHKALEVSPPAATDMFDSVYAEMPEQLRRQRETFRTDSIGQDPEQIGLKKR